MCWRILCWKCGSNSYKIKLETVECLIDPLHDLPGCRALVTFKIARTSITCLSIHNQVNLTQTAISFAIHLLLMGKYFTHWRRTTAFLSPLGFSACSRDVWLSLFCSPWLSAIWSVLTASRKTFDRGVPEIHVGWWPHQHATLFSVPISISQEPLHL